MGKSTTYKYRLQHRTDLKHQYSALSHTYPQTWIIGFYVIKFTCCGAPQLAKLTTLPLTRTRSSTNYKLVAILEIVCAGHSVM